MISKLRQEFHQYICQEIIRTRRNPKKGDYPNFADGDNKSSKAIAWSIAKSFGYVTNYQTLKAQTVGKLFEETVKTFLQNTFNSLQHLRPGEWYYTTIDTEISNFSQYEHLAYVAEVLNKDKVLGSALGGNYLVRPDVIVARLPVADSTIKQHTTVVNNSNNLATLTPFREGNYESQNPILHATISCKWTTRNDRAQNTRTEALNLIRNRKGHLPHIAVVTAEPLPTRIAALALGTGDVDCVYHFALPELKAALEHINNEDQLDMLSMLIEGQRLRDISDLPFDLAI